MSSFGVSGTNAHVVVEQAPVAAPVARQPEPVVSTLVVSGKTPARIASTAAMLAEWMAGDGADVSLADVAHTAQSSPHPAQHLRHGVCARSRAGGGRAAGTGGGRYRAGGGGPAAGAAWVGHGVRVFGSGFAMGRDGPAVVGR